MKAVKKCILCGRSIFRPVLIASDNMYNIPGKFLLVKCQCGLKFLNPQPDKELSKHYPSEYYSIAHTPQRSKISEFVYNTYFGNGSFVFKVLFFPIYPILRGAKVRPGKSVLDVGCGSGVFLSRMKALGMKVSGVDPFTKNNPALNIKKAELKSVKGQFDVITMNNVLEHVPNPVNDLKIIRKLLKADGTAIIAVPNVNSVFFKIFGRYWAELDAPRHLFHFNRKTLEATMKKAGLKVIKVRYNCVPFEITGSKFYILNSWRTNKKPLSKSWLANTKLNYLLLPVCHLMNLFHLGGRMEFYVKR